MQLGNHGVRKALQSCFQFRRDADLSFASHLKATLAKGCSIFNELFQAAEAGGFPAILLAAQVRIRIGSAVLSGSSVFGQRPNVESELNSLQICDPRSPWLPARPEPDLGLISFVMRVGVPPLDTHAWTRYHGMGEAMGIAR